MNHLIVLGQIFQSAYSTPVALYMLLHGNDQASGNMAAVEEKIVGLPSGGCCIWAFYYILKYIAICIVILLLCFLLS